MNKFEKISVFLVDDDHFHLKIIHQQLSNLGLKQIESFSAGQACLDHLDKKPTLVFLDYNMEDINGYEVLKKIKRYDPNIYVVILSGQEDVKIAVDALKHGAFDYIQKSALNASKIEEVLSKIVQVQELIEQSRPTIFKKLFQFL